jgi:hypothetical protein
MAESATPILRFPLESKTFPEMVVNGIAHQHPRVCFISRKWTTARPNLDNTYFTPGDTTSYTMLYLPANFKESYTAKWGVEQIPSSLIGGAGSVGANVTDTINRMARAAGAAGFVNAFNFGFGKTSYPNEFLTFQKGEPIPLNFSFELVPRNKPDSDEIEKIRANFKKLILPTYGEGNMFGGNYLLSYPDLWAINFQNITGVGFPDTPMQYNDMALINCDVEYGGSDQSTLTYPDNAPVSVKLTLQFMSVKHAYINKSS